MSDKKSLLVELFVEELPPKALKKLGAAFAETLAASLKAQGLAGEQSAVTPFASPRRLAVHISGVFSMAPDMEVVEKLMPKAVALDADGKPTTALRKRLAKVGREHLANLWPNAVDGPDSLELHSDGKTETLCLRGMARGVVLPLGLQSALEDALEALPIPKVMTYQLADGWSNVQFVRPAHGLVALHGSDVVTVHALGLEAGRETHGHRFEAQMDPVVLQHADHYAQQLLDQGAVMASFEQRHGEIARQLQHAAAQQGLVPIDDAALLDEVTALVERPRVLLGQFEEAFLEVPPECLILTMKANQKYFPLLDAAGKLTNKFLIVSNISPADTSRVVEGNERVVRPRLADAKFFFDQDRKKKLESRVAGLDKVVYHGKLGSQGERVKRVQAIAHAIVEQLRTATLPYTVEAKDQFDVLDSKVQQAARLAKTDLLTDMVGEFPELQGVMGGYYARHEGLRDGVAIAIEDHYKPRFAGDALPRNHTGIVLALADKLETLAGLFGIGQRPTGDKDPFALRRHALGLIRIVVERGLPIDSVSLVNTALAASWPAGWSDAGTDVLAFMDERLFGYCRDLGYSSVEVEAVVGSSNRLSLVPQLLAAVRAFSALPEAPALAAANKRVGNILKKSEAAVLAPQSALLREPAERALFAALEAVGPRSLEAQQAGDFTASLQVLAALKEPVDAFFDSVMVNTDDAQLRANRLGLLATLHAAMNRVADLSKLAT